MSEPISLPTTRPAGCPFDPPAELAVVRERAPITRLAYADGHQGWLVTGYELTRALLADNRFSSRYELLHDPLRGAGGFTAPPGDLSGIDPPEHTRFRRLLAGKFTVRRMRLLTDRIEQITAEHLDAMARSGPEVDLMTAYAQPIPALTICELLGVPYADRDGFAGLMAEFTSMDTSLDTMMAAWDKVQGYIGELATAKRAAPTDDLLSDLTSSDLTDAELAGVGAFLLGAGLETTAHMLGLGFFTLLRGDRAQYEALGSDPDLADSTVEEMLRYLSIAHTGVRAALEDVELGGQLVRTGESVAFSLAAANRDPVRFADPDRLDLRRNATGHVAFGHGVHQCLGQQLARVELKVAYPALARRFPTLRLAVPEDQVPLRSETNIYGVHALPVTWDA